MFMSNQSAFGSLTKSQKKRKRKKKRNKGSLSPSQSESSSIENSTNQSINGSNADSNAIQKSDDKLSEFQLPEEDIRFVLPRQPNASSNKLIPFLLPGQKQLLKSKNENIDASQNNEMRQSKVKIGTITAHETIDDIFGIKQPKSTTVESKSKTETSKREDGEGKSVEKDDINANSSKSKETDMRMAQDEEQRDKTILARSVQEVLKDKIGRRPRANSTDGELNLPQHGLCDERSVLLSHKWDLHRLYNCDGPQKLTPPRGLVNLGNTCFLNSTLQCLVYMPSFCQSIIDLPPSCYESNNGRTLRHGQRITMMFRSFLRIAHGITQREKNEPLRTNPFAPKTIAKAITSCKINGHRFRAGRQEDAHELLVHLLDAMHEGELFAAGINPNASGWRDKLPIPRLDETTFVHRIFGGYFRSQLKCNKCGYKSNTYDPFLDLALEISKKHINSLSSAFKEFTRREKLDMDNQWKCSGCKKHVCPTKHLSVFRPPLTLCIHLKRFGFGRDGFLGNNHFFHRSSKGLNMMGSRGSKISKRIEFPAKLSLPLSDGRVCDYTLTGVIVHVGGTATSGHYTAYVKQPGVSSKLWYHMDDSFVTEVSEKTVLKQRDAYVLFYTRKEVKLEFPQPPRIREQQNDAEQQQQENISEGSKTKSTLDSSQRSSNEEPDRKKPRLMVSASPGSESSATKHLNEANSSSSDSSSSDSSSESDQLCDVKKSLKFTPKQEPEKDLLKKQQKQSKKEKTMKGNNVEVILSRGKKKKAWTPPQAMKLSSQADNLLLGNITVGNWDSETAPNSLRDVAAKEMESRARSRKRKMHLDRWDAAIDEGKTKKVKDKGNQAELRLNMKQTSDKFQRIQREMQSMSSGRAKGFRSKDQEGRVSSFKKKKRKSMKR